MKERRRLELRTTFVEFMDSFSASELYSVIETYMG